MILSIYVAPSALVGPPGLALVPSTGPLSIGLLVPGAIGGRLEATAKRAAHDALASLLGGLELRRLRVEVTRTLPLTGVYVYSDATSRPGLRVGEARQAVSTHALGILERLRQRLGLLRRGGLAAVRQEVPAGLVGGLEIGRAWV